MRGQESEAYEIDAFARQRLSEMGFRQTGGNSGSSVFQRQGLPFLRVVITQGSCEGGILDYGRCVVERFFQGDWIETSAVSKQGFAYGESQLDMPYVISPDRIIDGPMP